MSCEIQELMANIDRHCARLNPGLTAIAIVLGGVVLATAADWAESRMGNVPVATASAFAVPANPLDFENPGNGD